MKNEKYISFLDNPRNKPKDLNINNIIIEENYMIDYNNDKISIKPYEPKLYDQLVGKDRQKSFSYNVLVMIFFNINMAHFCFPYITNKCGLGLTLLILLVCTIYSYVVQSSLIRYLSRNREYTESNYSNIIQSNFGEFCASFYETLIFIWYGIITIICMNTCKINLI